MNCSIFTTLFGVLFVVAFMGGPPSANAEGKAPVAIKAQPVSYQPFIHKIRTSGILAYKSQQTLSFKTSGPVSQLKVREGDRITQGQLLASLTLGEIRAQVDEAEARVVMAKNNLNRLTKLHRSNVVSLDKLQSAETDLTVAESKLRIAHFNFQYSSISAPSKGIVLRRFIEENELVNAYQPALLVADVDQGWVIRTGVSDKDVIRLRVGDKASVSFDAWPNRTFQGEVSQLATLADEKTGTFKIEITLLDTDQSLRSGFIGKVIITPSRKDQVTLLPIESVISSGAGSATVFVFDSDSETVSSRRIQFEFAEPGYIASRSGLKTSEWVVTQGAGLLRQGEKARLFGPGE